VNWLARGIGVVYSETTQQQQSGTDTSVVELVATNLVAPPVRDAGDGDAPGEAEPVLDAGADVDGE
jgi:hypothetical protein